MERLTRRLELARRALDTLSELTALPAPNLVERDAAIQRFEYTVEACWKAAQAVLDVRYGVIAASPKPVVRACTRNGLLTEADGHAAMAKTTRPTSGSPVVARPSRSAATHPSLRQRQEVQEVLRGRLNRLG